jgi:hypothetical protein
VHRSSVFLTIHNVADQLSLMPCQGRRLRLVQHLNTYHTSDSHHVASGTKQVKVVLALHTSDQLGGKTGGYALRCCETTHPRICDRDAQMCCQG